MITVREFAELERAYAMRATHRDRVLGATAVALVAGLLTFAFVGSRLAVTVALIALAALGLYTIVTSGRYFREADVRCASCKRSVIAAFSEELEAMDGGAPAPPALHCPHCATLIAGEDVEVPRS